MVDVQRTFLAKQVFKVLLSICYLNPAFLFPYFNYNKNLTCYCDKSYAGGDHLLCVNNRCDTKGDFEVLCYIQKLSPDDPVERGCRYYSECWSEKTTEKETGIRKKYCCQKESLCNEDAESANLTYFQQSVTPGHPNSTNDGGLTRYVDKNTTHSGTPTTQIIIYTVIPLSVCVVLFALFFLYKRYRKRGTTDTNTDRLLSTQIDSGIETSSRDFSQSGSGFGLPVFVRKTISTEVKLRENIGNGSFGAVFRGEWRGQDVAVKIFSTAEEASWSREVEVYTTTMLRHENVLGFIASDNKDTGACTQLWLICDYHPHGSLYDFLQKQTVTLSTLVQMIYGMINGLWHLHSEIIGAQGKPAMAHRDMKTKNILVKNGYTCCIADLGLTVLHRSIKNKIDMSPSSRTGTTRYQSPEILSQEIKSQCFESYQRADIYATGLCMWEVCIRVEIDGDKVLPHQLPYFDCVQSDPTAVDMKQVVCVEQRRPSFPQNWHKEKVMKMMMKTMKECWYHEPGARLTALRIKKNLSEIYKEHTTLC